MRRRLPPLDQIEAFMLAAHAPSFRVAAERCALSPAAFSRRIQAFSESLDLTLFSRTPEGARLTPAGERCLKEFEPAYAELRRAVEAVSEQRGGSSTVCLSLSHSLSVGWLIPRLDAFNAAHPELELTIKNERGAQEVRRGAADLGICASNVDLGGLPSEVLLPITMVPVAAPDVAERMKSEGRTLSSERLLGYSQPPDLWAWWAHATGHAETLEPSATFEIQHALYEAAARGLGIALGIGPTLGPFLESGRLTPLDLPPVRFPGEYRLVATAERRRRPAVAKVRRWLVGEARLTPELA